jgi:hypothetical protein
MNASRSPYDHYGAYSTTGAGTTENVNVGFEKELKIIQEDINEMDSKEDAYLQKDKITNVRQIKYLSHDQVKISLERRDSLTMNELDDLDNIDDEEEYNI